LHLYLLL